MVSIDKIKRGLANYADAEIISKIPGGGLKKLLIGTGLSLYISNLERVILENKDNIFITGLGVMHPDGNIEIEKLAEAIKSRMPDEGVQVNIELLGLEMKLNRSDVDVILSYIFNA